MTRHINKVKRSKFQIAYNYKVRAKEAANPTSKMRFRSFLTLLVLMATGAICQSSSLTLCTGGTSGNKGFCIDSADLSDCSSSNGFQLESDSSCEVFPIFDFVFRYRLIVGIRTMSRYSFTQLPRTKADVGDDLVLCSYIELCKCKCLLFHWAQPNFSGLLHGSEQLGGNQRVRPVVRWKHCRSEWGLQLCRSKKPHCQKIWLTCATGNVLCAGLKVSEGSQINWDCHMEISIKVG
jgi:hypothetical protein